MIVPQHSRCKYCRKYFGITYTCDECKEEMCGACARTNSKRYINGRSLIADRSITYCAQCDISLAQAGDTIRLIYGEFKELNDQFDILYKKETDLQLKLEKALKVQK